MVKIKVKKFGRVHMMIPMNWWPGIDFRTNRSKVMMVVSEILAFCYELDILIQFSRWRRFMLPTGDGGLIQSR